MDIRTAAAKYYDVSPTFPDDIPFYLRMLPSADVSVLELGCGTGRVTLPLASACNFVHGLDISQTMIDVCRQKLAAAHVSTTRARLDVADITSFSFTHKFDLIIAPFRVLQNLETDQHCWVGSPATYRHRKRNSVSRTGLAALFRRCVGR